jgi:hypothetical protein
LRLADSSFNPAWLTFGVVPPRTRTRSDEELEWKRLDTISDDVCRVEVNVWIVADVIVAAVEVSVWIVAVVEMRVWIVAVVEMRVWIVADVIVAVVEISVWIVAAVDDNDWIVAVVIVLVVDVNVLIVPVTIETRNALNVPIEPTSIVPCVAVMLSTAIIPASTFADTRLVMIPSVFVN